MPRIAALVALGAILTAAAIALFLMHRHGVIGGEFTQASKTQILPEGSPQDRSVLIVGTSLTSRGDWVETLDRELSSCGVSVEKLARAAAASDWGLEQLDAWYRQGNRAGLVIIEFSGNDASPIHGMSLGQSRRNHAELIAMAQQNGSLVTLATMSPGWKINALERPGQDRYHAVYRDLAKAGVGLIDTIEVWRSLDEADRRVMVPDDLHPTSEAMHAITVPNFRSHIEQVFCG